VIGLLLEVEGNETRSAAALWLPFLLPGLAWAFDWLRAIASRRPDRLLVAGALAFIAWNGLFMEQYRLRFLPSDDTVSFSEVTSNSGAILSRAIGTPLAWPANWIFAKRFHVPPDAWDAVAGRRLFKDAHSNAAVVEIGDDPSISSPDEPLIVNGFNVRRTCGQGWCRDVFDTARMLLPVQNPGNGEFVLTVHVRGEGRLTMALDRKGTVVERLSSAFTDLTLRLPARSIEPGVHVLSFSTEGGGRATIDRLTLSRDLSSGSAR
jgi:hypothetical protein